MSRTDKTKPLWVRCAEHHPRPLHDHRHAPCDLPAHLTRDTPNSHCQWGFPHFGTTCCSGPNGRAAKRERGDLKKACNRRGRYAARRFTCAPNPD
ncbi:hypothetical protein ACIBCN_05225 [Nocardia sp. NPDC051052]|uniref:hypothetical protein n=1 Tax=Nocardia sp. NPDC051052 TaxID=3364322 RepID=UPI00379EF342